MKVSKLLASLDKETFVKGLQMLDDDFFNWLSDSNSTFMYSFELKPRSVSKYTEKIKELKWSPNVLLPSNDNILGCVGYYNGELYTNPNSYPVMQSILRIDLLSIVESYENIRSIRIQR